MTLKGKFTLISGLVVLVISATLITNVVTLRGLIAKTDATEDAAEMIQHHLHADMMHDAVRADVLAALYAATRHDAGAAAKAAHDLRQHGQALAADIDAVLKMNPPADIAKDIEALKADAAEYRDTAQSLATAAGQGHGAPDMSVFNTQFSAFEEKAAAISDALEKQLNALNADEDSAALSAETRDVAMAVFSILAALSVPFYSRWQVFQPQEKLIEVMEGISGGALDGEIPYQARPDEIGAVARALKIFQGNAAEKVALEVAAIAAKKRSEDEKRAAMFGLADHFEANVKSVADTVASAATEMDATSRDVLKRGADSGEKLGQLVRGITGASQNVQMVAAAATELSASIREIGQQVEHGNTIMSAAVTEAGRANAQAASLTEAAQRIGTVIDVINEVTGQINLLALNATIEAARAGEQGRGFAVVASEIKNLASQTTAATRQVAEQIALIQGAAGETVVVLEKISGTIGTMNKISTSIAAAVEEQGMATQEIARNVQQAAEITTMVSGNANDVRDSSAGTSSAVSQMIAAASDLSRQSESLRAQVGAFLKDIKAA